MAKTGTYALIASNTLTTSATTVTFSSIPSTFTDLVLVINHTLNTNNYINFQVNGDTGNNYSYTYMRGDGTSAGSGRGSNVNVLAGAAPGQYGVMISHFMDYSNTTTFKTVLIAPRSAASEARQNVAIWRSTSAINSITVIGDSANQFASGSTFRLYGIQAYNGAV